MTKKIDNTIFNSRILMLDGAMGTMIQHHNLTEDDFHCSAITFSTIPLKGNNECLNLSRPELIYDIHRAYISAGADIIETNTFSANRLSQSGYGTEALARTMALEGAKIARRAADDAMRELETAGTPRRILVAGSVGPTSKSLSMPADYFDLASRAATFDEMADAYREQIGGLIEGGVDLVIIETCFDALNAKAALYALDGAVPAIVSATVNEGGRTLTGQTVEAFYRAVSSYPLLAFGLNCSFGANAMSPIISQIDAFSDVPVICYPNAGLPNQAGEYDQTPEQMADAMRALSPMLNIAGGCCGTTPEHIRATRAALAGCTGRPLRTPSEALFASGLESLEITPGAELKIGRTMDISTNPAFAGTIAAGDYDSALSAAYTDIADGARLLMIDIDGATANDPQAMESLVRYTSFDPSIASVPLLISSSNPDTVKAALKNSQGRCLVAAVPLCTANPLALSEIQSLGAALFPAASNFNW